MSRSDGFFTPRHDDSVELVEANEDELLADESEALALPGKQNSDVARQAEATREQRQGQEKREEREEDDTELKDPALRALAAALPPPPPPARERRTYTPADGVDGPDDKGQSASASPMEGEAGEPAPTPAGLGWSTLLAPPPPPPSAPPLEAPWLPARRDDE